MKSEKITSIIFILLLFSLTVLSFLVPQKLYSETENRMLAQKPEFSLKNFFSGNYSEDYEEFLNDQFVFKDNWVKFKTTLELIAQKKDINNVYISDDNYFIEKHTNINEDQFNKNLDFVDQFVKNSNKLYSDEHVKVLIAPLASEVLKDKLPSYAPNYDQNIIIDKFKEKMPDNFIDVRESLTKHKDEYIYYKTDHHLTTLGTYYLYLDIAKSFGFTPLSLDEFKITKVSDEFLGTTISKINIETDSPDEIYIFEPLKENNISVTYDMVEKSNSLYAEDKLSTKDKYAYFLNGNKAFVEINTEIKNGKNLFIVKDSYANCLIPFLIHHFENIYVVDLRYLNINVPSYAKQLNTTDILVIYNAINFTEDKYLVKLRTN